MKENVIIKWKEKPVLPWVFYLYKQLESNTADSRWWRGYIGTSLVVCYCLWAKLSTCLVLTQINQPNLVEVSYQLFSWFQTPFFNLPLVRIQTYILIRSGSMCGGKYTDNNLGQGPSDRLNVNEHFTFIKV